MHLSGKERKINLGIVVMLHRLLFDIPRISGARQK
jgi:hypothetical protein